MGGLMAYTKEYLGMITTHPNPRWATGIFWVQNMYPDCTQAVSTQWHNVCGGLNNTGPQKPKGPLGIQVLVQASQDNPNVPLVSGGIQGENIYDLELDQRTFSPRKKGEIRSLGKKGSVSEVVQQTETRMENPRNQHEERAVTCPERGLLTILIQRPRQTGSNNPQSQLRLKGHISGTYGPKPVEVLWGHL